MTPNVELRLLDMSHYKYLRCEECSTEEDGTFVSVIDVVTLDDVKQEEEFFYCIKCFHDMMNKKDDE